MNTSMMRCILGAVMAMVFGIGCNSTLDDQTVQPNEPAGISEPVGQVEQAITGCELDCSDGRHTCGSPCSVSNNTLFCNNVATAQCSCIRRTCASAGANCGTIADGCGGTLSCGAPVCPGGAACVSNVCEQGCPAGKSNCCNDNRCLTDVQCLHACN